MSPSHLPDAQQRVVATLRAAGCVFAEDEAALLFDNASNPAELEDLVLRRVAGTPLEHLLGWVEFCGRRVAVTPGVFVPRRRTEFLAEQAVAAARSAADRGGARVVELCCGCAAIGVHVMGELPAVDLWCADLDPVAVACAAANLAGSAAHAVRGDLYDPLPSALRGRVDVIVANAPYVPTDELALMPREAREHEPTPTRDGGADGLVVLRRIIETAPQWLRSGGAVLVETTDRQVDTLAAGARSAALQPEISRSSERGAVVLSARRQTPTG